MVKSARWFLLTALMIGASGCSGSRYSLSRLWSRDPAIQTAEIDGKQSPAKKRATEEPRVGKSKDSAGVARLDAEPAPKSSENKLAEKSASDADRRVARSDKKETEIGGTSITERPYGKDSTSKAKPVRKGEDPFLADDSSARDKNSKTVAQAAPVPTRKSLEAKMNEDALKSEAKKGDSVAAKKSTRLEQQWDESTPDPEVQKILEASHQKPKGKADDLPSWAAGEKVEQIEKSPSVEKKTAPVAKAAPAKKTVSRWDDLEVAEEIEKPVVAEKPQRTAAAVAKTQQKAPTDDDDWGSVMSHAPVAETPSVAKAKPTPAPAATATITETAANPPAKSSLLRKCPGLQGEARDIVATLETSDVESLKRQLNRLGQLDIQAAPAAPAVREFINHRDPFVQIYAGLTLFRLQQADDTVVAVLARNLQANDPAVRSFAAAVLAEMGPACQAALPALAKALNDPDVQVRLHAAKILVQHDAYSNRAMNVLKACLTDADPTVRWLATYAMADLAPQQTDVVIILARLLKDQEKQVQMGAAYALGAIGPLSRPTVPELQLLATDPDHELRAAAQHALRLIQEGR